MEKGEQMKNKKNKILLSLLLAVPLLGLAISAQAKELKEFPLIESPELVSECGITSMHFYSSPGPDDLKHCFHVTRDDWNSPNSNTLKLLEPSTNIDLGNNNVFSFAPYGLIFKDRVKIKINDAFVISPNPTDMMQRIFNGSPTVYTVVKYPKAENPTHYFIATHFATIVYEIKNKRFCPYYIRGDATRFFQHETKGLIAANIGYFSPNKMETIKAYLIDLHKLCSE